MFNKRVIFIGFLLILIFGFMSSVNANDSNQTAEDMVELTSPAVGEIICDSPDGETVEVQESFIDLDKLIKSSDDTEIYLNNNYTFNPEFDIIHNDGITINRPVTIWGNGHTLDGANAARIFDVDSENVIFHNIIFINGKTNAYGGAINGHCTAENCTFIANTACYGGATDGVDCFNCTFSANTAKYNGGAASGGSFINCTFNRNNAYHLGGAIYTGSNMRIYPIENCTFTENRANVGGAINIQFSGYVPVSNCIFTKNTAAWDAGAIYNVACTNCTFTENSADYGGAMKYGSANNCIFNENSANFGGASYQSICINCTFTENYADYGGAIYEGWRTEYCIFTGNYAFYGGAINGYSVFSPENCHFTYNYAQSGGAAYQAEVKNSYFAYNAAIEYGGAMYGESAINCTFMANNANIAGNDTFSTQLINSTSSYFNNIVYFNANAAYDGNGSKSNPYKYLYADRICPGVTAYFADGTYDLDSTCTITNGAKLIGEGSYVIINSKMHDQYDFIIQGNSFLEFNRLVLNDIHILNQATFKAKNCNFKENRGFDLDNLPEIESGSGILDASYGGVILCDTPESNKTAIILDGCTFQNLYNAFSGGAIAAINSKISISNTWFMYYSSTYKGGAIYSENSDLELYNVRFTPYLSSNEGLLNVEDHYDRYSAYYGGSIYSKNSNIFIDKCKFLGSISFSFGGCIAALNSNITIRESDFNNSVSMTDGGGAIYNSKSELYIFNSNFINNNAEFGGAICNLDSILSSYRSIYSDNSANCYGGVIYDIYGTMEYFSNLFYGSHALAGGAVYTRISNNFTVVGNEFGNSFAKEGSSIFYDGKKENTISNYYSNNYHVFAEFRANLNGEEYYIISNPLYYKTSSEINSDLLYPSPVYEVHDDLVSMLLYGTDDERRLTSISNHHRFNNISIDVNFSDQLTNLTLNVYFFEGLDVLLYNRGWEGNLYTGSRDKLFKDYKLIGNYSIDMSDKVQNGNYNFTESLTIDFGNPFLSIKHDNLYEAASFNPVSLVNTSMVYLTPLPSQIDVLSAYYNSNDLGFVTSVKDQKTGGNCWAFSGIATLETCLSKATGIKYEFSVENTKNLMSAYSIYGMKIETNHAGYESMLLSYLTSWLGPIDESKEAYDDFSSISLLENPMFHIQNVRFLPARTDSADNTAYKLAIKDNGAVSVTFKWGDGYHSVSLVGWDDNYAGCDSLGNPSNGAWIFKNSWGPEWENNGFGYLSYDEKISEQIYPNLHAYTFVFNDNNPYTKIYQYDFAGVSEFYHYMDSIYFKNTFTADNDTLLSAFSTYFDRMTNFTVMVYKNDEFVFAQNGTSSAGYFTIPFDTFVKLDSGDRFTILLNNHNEGYNCIPVCSAEEITKMTFSSNVSFISLDGENWFDLYDYAGSCNVACIKAFTQNINLTAIRIEMNEFDTVPTKNMNIKVNFDGFDVDLINYYLMTFIIDGSIYYAQIINGTAILNINLDDGVHSMFVQYKDNVFESNIIRFNFTVKRDDDCTSFNALQDLINAAGENSVISLDKDYFYDWKFDDGRYGIHINKTITLNANGHSIDGLSRATGLYVIADNVVLNDLIVNNTSSSNGGGIYIAAHNVTLNRCSFINSKASQYGGGIYSLFDVKLNNCEFINNSANNGGAIYAEGTGTVMISSSNFTSNTARNGGAVFSNANCIEFNGCHFSNNSAEKLGGAITAYNRASIHDSIFENNAAYDGGAVGTAESVINCIFTNNSATNGGAIDSAKVVNGSIFKGNSANYGGAIDNAKSITSSIFINNSAKSGGAIYYDGRDELQVSGSDFTNNSANYGGAIYYDGRDELQVFDCNFTGNHALYGGAIYSRKYEDYYTKSVSNTLINASRFAKNSADNIGGCILSAGKLNVYSSEFKNNSAKYGGTIYSDDEANIHRSSFKDNMVNMSGGAIYMGGNAIKSVESCEFINNAATYGGAIIAFDNVNVSSCNFTDNKAKTYGGAIDFYENGNYSITSSSFENNSANYGGAIYIYASDEESMAHLNVSYCNFTKNNAFKSGGAFYTDALTQILTSNLINNTANWGSALYCVGYIYVDKTNITSDTDSSLIEYSYHYTDENTSYGKLNLKDNNIDAEGKIVHYNINGIDSDAKLYLVFTNIATVKGNNISVCRLEDEEGNSVYATGFGNLKITLIDQSNNRIQLSLNYSKDYEGYYLDTSSIDYGTYRISGSLTNKQLKYTVMPAVLQITDRFGRTAPAISVSSLVKVYGKGDKLAVSLRDPSGDVISNAQISVELNGKTSILITDSKGHDSMNVNQVPGTYYAHISFEDNGYYTSAHTTVKIIIKKATPKLIAKKKTFKLNAKSKKYTVTLKNNLGKAMKKAKLTVKVKGKTYTAKTNSKGKATFNLKLTKKGTFKATVTYKGNKYYNKVTKKVKITVN